MPTIKKVCSYVVQQWFCSAGRRLHWLSWYRAGSRRPVRRSGRGRSGSTICQVFPKAGIEGTFTCDAATRTVTVTWTVVNQSVVTAHLAVRAGDVVPIGSTIDPREREIDALGTVTFVQTIPNAPQKASVTLGLDMTETDPRDEGPPFTAIRTFTYDCAAQPSPSASPVPSPSPGVGQPGLPTTGANALALGGVAMESVGWTAFWLPAETPKGNQTHDRDCIAADQSVDQGDGWPGKDAPRTIQGRRRPRCTGGNSPAGTRKDGQVTNHSLGQTPVIAERSRSSAVVVHGPAKIQRSTASGCDAGGSWRRRLSVALLATTMMLGGLLATAAPASASHHGTAPATVTCANSKPSLREGSTASCVASLQHFLMALAFISSDSRLSTGGIDSHFGSTTAGAVRRFQELRGLTQDGRVGNHTWTAIAGDCAIFYAHGILTICHSQVQY